MNVHLRRTGIVVLVVSLLSAGIAGQFLLAARRPVRTDQISDSAIAALGGLRALASEVVWFRAGRLQREGRYVELAQLAATLTRLDPYDAEVWQYAACNLAYNIAAMMPTPEDRWRWVEAGIRLLRDGGIAVNPSEAGIYRELALIFELKMGTNLDSAHAHYRARWRGIVADVQARAAADPARADAIWGELGMKPSVMREVAARHGLKDWTEPLASAIYWAEVGSSAVATDSDRALLEGIVEQSKNLLAKRKNMVK